jgi:hypothetical protein
MVEIDPMGPLIVRAGGATDLAVDAAIAGTGIIYLFEDWLRPHLDGGASAMAWRFASIARRLGLMGCAISSRTQATFKM